jgi:predicted SPOUT superfamily RNA methylase MTH1
MLVLPSQVARRPIHDLGRNGAREGWININVWQDFRSLMLQKRKRESNGPEVDTSKPSAIFAPTGGRLSTLSVALPGSIIANAKSHEQKTSLAGTIARALAVFCVDEVIIFNDELPRSNAQAPGENEYTAFTDSCHFLAHILSYLETPAYLRKSLFAMHPNLRTAGTLPSLDMPHHLRAGEWCDYREGVTVNTANGSTSVEVGLSQKRLVEGLEIPPNTRVTLKLHKSDSAEAVAPTEPREVDGYYWGYTVRRCESLSAVFTECPFDGGYSVSVGTSERGVPLSDVNGLDVSPDEAHILLVFGGLAGLETATKNDAELRRAGVNPGTVSELFDYWVNVCPGQGSRTIRTEEAVWLGLMGLKAVVQLQKTSG